MVRPAQGFRQGHQYSIEVPHHLEIGVAHCPNSALGKQLIVASRIFKGIMRVPIDLDGQLSCRAVKIDDPRSEYLLPAKLEPFQPFSLQSKPKPPFRFCRIVAHTSGARFERL